MQDDLDPIIGLVRLGVKAGILLGHLWHSAIEAVNRWLWKKDWAWANDSRYQRSQYR